MYIHMFSCVQRSSIASYIHMFSCDHAHVLMCVQRSVHWFTQILGALCLFCGRLFNRRYYIFHTLGRLFFSDTVFVLFCLVLYCFCFSMLTRFILRIRKDHLYIYTARCVIGGRPVEVAQRMQGLMNYYYFFLNKLWMILKWF